MWLLLTQVANSLVVFFLLHRVNQFFLKYLLRQLISVVNRKRNKHGRVHPQTLHLLLVVDVVDDVFFELLEERLQYFGTVGDERFLLLLRRGDLNFVDLLVELSLAL